MDFDAKLRNIEESIKENVIDVYDSDLLSIPIKLAYFELQGYTNLIIELNKLRYSCISYTEKKNLNYKYKRVYLSSRRMYRRLLRNLCNGTLTIRYPRCLEGEEECFYGALSYSCKFNKEKSLDENIVIYMKLKLNQRIYETNEELFKLNQYPNYYINTFTTFIGPYSVAKYEKDIIFYKDVFIAVSEEHHFSIFYNENSTEETKKALLSILAYFNGEPYFYFTENYNFNRKICELYEKFDLLDMLRLRKKNFFDSKREEPFIIELPILKTKNGYNLICFDDIQHEMIFELYHASLKQFESLPRCIFLYRVFEYGSIHHYQPLFKPNNYRPEDALDYYANEIMTHSFNPLYYVDAGTYESEDRKKIIRERKAKYVNITTRLRKEVKIIKKEWSGHPYLKNKTIGNIIYVTGRNAAAHGAGDRRNARYDYSMNYKHINDVNVFLELIARYLIEKLNPQITNMVERKIKCYIQHNQYEKIFEKKKDS
ncbi:hypothetical protein [Clostridium akagii]|uniref:hypothetical protein n=1 Tax=Clostridium akagii TaxID=91623 RepID=UPI00047E5E57|nr:hypothetical protein [Clostridium akagii]